MSNIPYGYEMINGGLVPHPFESKVVSVTNGLMAIGLNSLEVKDVLNGFEVPKRGQDYNEYPIDEKIHEIYQTGSKLYSEKVLLKIENLVDDLVSTANQNNNNFDLLEFQENLQRIKKYLIKVNERKDNDEY